MARFHVIPRCPLTVQFWLLGLDARCGDLQHRGFIRQPTTYGSSSYALGPLTLHSAGLKVQLPAGVLQFTRRIRIFTLDGDYLPTLDGLSLCRPVLLEHEAWASRTHGPDHRSRQLLEHRLPSPVRRNVPVWQAYVEQGEAQEDFFWTMPQRHRAKYLS